MKDMKLTIHLTDTDPLSDKIYALDIWVEDGVLHILPHSDTEDDDQIIMNVHRGTLEISYPESGVESDEIADIKAEGDY